MKVEELVVSEILDMVFSRIPQDSLDELKAGTYQRNNGVKIYLSAQRDMNKILCLRTDSQVLKLDMCEDEAYVDLGTSFAWTTDYRQDVFESALSDFSDLLNKSDLEPFCDLISDWYECFDFQSKTTDVFKLHDLTKSRIQQLNQE